MLTGNPPGDWPYGAAFSIAPMSRLATKVLCKKAMQPAPWACIRVASSSKAVMKMTGSWQPDAVRCAATQFRTIPTASRERGFHYVKKMYVQRGCPTPETVSKPLDFRRDLRSGVRKPLLYSGYRRSSGAKREKRPASHRAIRGGLTTKIHALVDALGNPIELMLTPGNAHHHRF